MDKETIDYVQQLEQRVAELLQERVRLMSALRSAEAACLSSESHALQRALRELGLSAAG